MSTTTRTPRRAGGGRPAHLRWALLPVALLLLSACGSEPDEDPSAATPTSGSTTAPTTEATDPSPSVVAPPPQECGGGSDVVDVTTADELRTALEEARPGRTVRLAAGTYEGNFRAAAEGTAEAPIRLCGNREAVLDGGDVEGDYTLHLSGASYWHVSGFTVTGGQKGVMVDAGAGNRIEGLMVTSMGDEAIHLRTHSTDNVVVGNTIRDTGLRKPKFGEGVYVGSAESNWCQLTDCDPDRSDRNVIEGNDIAGTTAEAVDIKEGTSDGLLRGNTFDGSDMVEADSWVDVKGNGWSITDNTGSASPTDGFQVHEVLDGWGQDTVFSGNAVQEVPGLAINVAGPRTIRNSTVVACDNDVDGADGGGSNVECSDR